MPNYGSDLDEFEQDLIEFGASKLMARFERLKSRRFVLFPYLRARMLLRKLRKLTGCQHCSHTVE